MKQFALLISALFFGSCQNSINKFNVRDNNLSSSIESEQITLDNDSIKTKYYQLAGDSIVIKLTEQNLNNDRYKTVSPVFYQKYISNDSSNFVLANDTLDANTPAKVERKTKYYSWGKINSISNYTFEIIYEYYWNSNGYDGGSNKLFLFTFDSNNILKSKLLVSMFNNRHRDYSESKYSVLTKNMHVTTIDYNNGAMYPTYEGNKGEIKTWVDSIKTEYIFKNGIPERTNVDTLLHTIR